MSINAQPSRPRTPEQLQSAIDRAMHKAREQALAGNIPVLVRDFTSPDGLEQRQFWTVGSRTTGGVVYDVSLTASASGIETLCHCDGANAGRICWHRAAVRLAALGELDYHTVRRPVLGVTLAELHGQPTAGRVLVDADGHGTAPDPWDAESFAAVV